MGELIKLLKALVSPARWLSSRANRWRLRGARVEVITCVLCRNPEPSILLAQSPYDKLWMPPQEGVNLRESFDAAVVRCLKVECGINVSTNPGHASRKLHFRSTRFVGHVKLPPERRGERPVADDVIGTWLESVSLRRKAYWVATILIAERSDISPKPDGKKLIDLAWYSLADARRVISETNTADKARLLFKVLDACERDLRGASRTRLEANISIV